MMPTTYHGSATVVGIFVAELSYEIMAPLEAILDTTPFVFQALG
jgi:hypothetical protein